MKQAQLQISVHIQKVKLQVRFPSSITAQLKIENQQIPFGQEIPLRLGQAMFDLTATHKFSALYDTIKSSFQETRISVLIFLKTSSGRIPAGAVSINLNSLRKGVNKLSCSIEKCPDKQALMQLSISYECLNQIDCYPSGMARQGSSVFSGNATNRISFGAKSNKDSPKSHRQNEEAIERNQSTNNRHGQNVRTEEVLYGESSRELQREGQGSENRAKSFRNTSINNMDYSNHRSKVHEMQRDLKQLYKKCQQQALQLRTQSTKRELIQRSSKQTQSQLRSYKQKYDDIRLQYENSQKKTDFKDNSLKDQIKSLTQKLSRSEAEKQKMIFEKNDLVNEFQEREKNLRLGLREKQRIANEQKVKVSKQLERLNIQFNQHKSESNDMRFNFNDTAKELQLQKTKNEQLENKNVELLETIQKIKHQLKQEKALRQQLEESLSSNKQLEEEKKKMKKKTSELEQEISNHLKQISTIQATDIRNTKKIQALQSILKDKTTTIMENQKQADGLNKQIQSLKTTISQRQRKIEELTTLKQKQNQKNEKFTSQTIEARKRLDDQLKTTRTEVKEKEQIIRNLNQSLRHSNDQVNELNKINNQFEIRLSQFQHSYNELQIKNEELYTSEINIESEKKQVQAELQAQIDYTEGIEKEYRQYIASKAQEIKSLQLTIKNLENSLTNSNQQLAFQISTLERKIAELNEESIKREEQIRNLKATIEALQNEKMKGSTTSEQLSYNLKLKVNEITFLKESVDKMNQQINDYINQNKDLSLQIETQRKQISELEEQVRIKSKQLGQANSSGSSIKQELQQYKAKNIQDISSFLKAIIGGKIESAFVHQQSEIVNLMQQAIEHNNSYVAEKAEQIQHLYTEMVNNESIISDLRKEQQQNARQINALQERLTEEITKNLELTQGSETSLQSLNQQLKTTCSALEQEKKKNTVLKTNMKILQDSFKKQQEELLNKSSSQYTKLNAEIENLKGKLNQLAEKHAEKVKQFSDLEKVLDTNTKEFNLLAAQNQAKIQSLQKEINTLKDLNENIRKRNEAGSTREKELQQEIKKIKNENLIGSKKESELQKSLTKQISQNVELKLNISQEQQSHQQQIQSLNGTIEELTNFRAQLEKKISTLQVQINQAEKQTNLQEQFLKPIKQNISILRGHVTEYMRVGDQFQANKNKLLKMANIKIEQYTDKNVADKLREVSFTYQKLKAFLLSINGLTPNQKESIVEELKKVQLGFDRALRGDK